MKLPSPNEARLPPQSNGVRPVDWDKLDIVLKLVTDRGVLTKLAKAMSISLTTLRKRRRKLGLPDLGRGRPPKTTLSPTQEEFVNLLESGMSVSEIAGTHNISVQAVSNAIRNAKKRLAYWETTRCMGCNGYGVVGGTLDEPLPYSHALSGGHSLHVCGKCKGKGTVDAQD